MCSLGEQKEKFGFYILDYDRNTCKETAVLLRNNNLGFQSQNYFSFYSTHHEGKTFPREPGGSFEK